jgi:hypothetical protein
VTNLRILSVFDVLLTIEEPVGNLELAWVQQDGGHLFQILFRQFTSTTMDVDSGFATAGEGKTTADTLDSSQSERNLSVTINVRVQNTKMDKFITSN